jgi:hypothetical protein
VGVDVESSVFDRKPHGGGAGPQLLKDAEAALARALKGSDTQTVEVMELMMAVTNAKIAEVRPEPDEGSTVIMPTPGLLYTGNYGMYEKRDYE